MALDGRSLIVVMGEKGCGKTCFVNLASGSNLGVGTNSESGITQVQLSNEFILDGQRIVLIDTPGFDGDFLSDTEVLRMAARFIATEYETGPKVAGVIYIHNISGGRFTGISARNFKMFRELCGDSTLKNIILVTNMWGEVTSDVGESRERELITSFFKPVLDKGAQLTRHHNTTRSAYDIIQRIKKDPPTPPRPEEGYRDRTIDQELNEQVRRHREELKTIRDEIAQRLREKDEEFRRELEQETRRLQEQMRVELERMASDHNKEKRRMEAEMWRMQGEARAERERLLDQLNSLRCP